MGFAYVLSVCSSADAFVASSFGSTFTEGALLAFLVFGPMIDIKSTLMLFAYFKKRFVLFLLMVTPIVVYLFRIISYKYILFRRCSMKKINKVHDFSFHHLIRGIILIGFMLLLFKLLITNYISLLIAPKMIRFIYFTLFVCSYFRGSFDHKRNFGS